MRSPLWFVVAAIIGVGGFVAAGISLVSGLGNLDEALMQIVMPDSATLKLSKPGTYTIFHEHRSQVGQRYYATSDIGGLRLRVTSPSGEDVALVRGGNSTYKFGGREGRSIFSFVVATPGDYRITGMLPDGRTEPKIVLAVGQGVLGGMFAMIGGALAMAFGGLAIAGLIVVITLWQRGKAKRVASSPVS